MTGPSDKANRAMGEMEDTLDDLQGEVVEAKAPPRNHFKPTGMILMVLVALAVGGGAFLAVSALRDGPRDAKSALGAACHARNENIVDINKKFADLNLLFDISLANRSLDEPPLAPVVIKALEDFKKPIPLVDCETITKGLRSPP